MATSSSVPSDGANGPADLRQSTREQNLCQKVFSRDRELLIAIIVLIIILNIPYGQLILYPFIIFSTWIHEMCHGMAAVFAGGEILSLRVYPDGSGLAFTTVPYEDEDSFKRKRVFVASAGYMGTALIGGFLLLFRRTKYGPTIGTISIGALMLLSCMLWIRNVWGVFVIIFMGLLVLGAGCMAAFEWRLKKVHLGYLFAFLAATCSFNALTSIQHLFAAKQYSVGGEMRDSDAHAVAEYLGLDAVVWAFLWLLFALLTSALGILFPIDGEATCCPTSCPFSCSSSCCERGESTSGAKREKNSGAKGETEIVPTTPSINWATEENTAEKKKPDEGGSTTPSWLSIN